MDSKKHAGEDLAAFLRRSEQAAAIPEADAEEEQDEETLLAAAKAAIPAGADVAALVKAGADPDCLVPIETRAAFGLWVDRDPIAALRWLTEWRRDASDTRGLDDEVARNLHQVGLAKLGLYLRELPAARDFLISAATEKSIDSCFGEVKMPADKAGSAEVLQVAATLGSPGERSRFLFSHFSSLERCIPHLPQIRALLDDRSAAKFLGELNSGNLSPGQVAALEASGFPPHAVAQFLMDHPEEDEEPAGVGRDLAALGTGMEPRTNADFIGTVAKTSIPGVPAATRTNVTDIVTGGLRSGDGPINRNNIDAVLNNPNRTAMPPLNVAEKIGTLFHSRNAVSWAWFAGMDLQSLPGYAESREDFLRGKMTGEEWVARLQGEIPGAGDLHDELTSLAFRLTVEDDPRRALGLLDAANKHRGIIMEHLPGVTPETLVAMAGRLFGDGFGDGRAGTAVEAGLFERMREWAKEDPEAHGAYLEAMPAGTTRDYLHEDTYAERPIAEEEVKVPSR